MDKEKNTGLSSSPGDTEDTSTRRSFLKKGLFAGALGALSALGGFSFIKSRTDTTVWQIDPDLCIQCGRCADSCVLALSAVKCVHAFAVCGYCDLCGGYYKPDTKILDTAAEHQLCPTGAIKRTFIEDPYYEYVIDEQLCIGCAKCVKGCSSFGNGSLFLQIRHDRCTNCNQCKIASDCPAQAIKRVSNTKPYILPGENS